VAGLEDAEGRRQPAAVEAAVEDAVESKKKNFRLPFIHKKWMVQAPFVLKIGERARVRRGESRRCRHGFRKNLQYAEAIHSFLELFANGYNIGPFRRPYKNYNAAVDATYGSHSNAWHNHHDMEQVVLFCLAAGTDSILDQDEDLARTYALLACFFEQYADEAQAAIDLDKVDAMMCGAAIDLPQLSNFFKKRIPCSCLGDEHEEVKPNIEMMTTVYPLPPLNATASQGLDEKEEEQKKPMNASGQTIEPTLIIDERGRPYLSFEVAVVENKYVPLRQKNDGSYEYDLVKEKSQEEEEVEDAKISSKIEMMEQVQGEFWLDQLSYYDLPASFVPHQCITAWSGREYSYGEEDRCWHGKASIRRGLYTQACKFDLAFTDAYNDAGGVLNSKIITAYHTTMDTFTDVWNSEAAMKFIALHFMSAGTGCLLGGDTKAASHYASIAYFFDQHVVCNLRKDRPTMNWPKMNELYFDPDEHTLVSFFKKRISCSCLDDMYEQVKSVKKLGICYNVNCPLPDHKAIRSFTKCCSRCRRVNYCSRECQEDNWQSHKIFCDGYVQRDSTVVPTTYDESSTCAEVSVSEVGDQSSNTCVEEK
jgi:hypothetical protein